MKIVLINVTILVFASTLPILSICAQTTRAGHSVSKRHITSSFAIDTVLGLLEIRQYDAYIRRVTKGNRHLIGMIDGEPDSLHPYYWVKIGEDNGMSFVTHFTFFVYINGKQILYHDNVCDSTIDLKLWRAKYRKTR